MSSFTPWSALAGGALIGLAASMLLIGSGRIAGISGIVGGVIRPESKRPREDEWRWRMAFLAGLVLGGIALAGYGHGALGVPTRGLGALAVAGLLVGYGARLGQGCTSGHGVCGLARLSKRALAAVLTFMATGIATATAVRLLGGLS